MPAWKVERKNRGLVVPPRGGSQIPRASAIDRHLASSPRHPRLARLALASRNGAPLPVADARVLQVGSPREKTIDRRDWLGGALLNDSGCNVSRALGARERVREQLGEPDGRPVLGGDSGRSRFHPVAQGWSSPRHERWLDSRARRSVKNVARGSVDVARSIEGEKKKKKLE